MSTYAQTGRLIYNTWIPYADRPAGGWEEQKEVTGGANLLTSVWNRAATESNCNAEPRVCSKAGLQLGLSVLTLHLFEGLTLVWQNVSWIKDQPVWQHPSLIRLSSWWAAADTNTSEFIFLLKNIGLILLSLLQQIRCSWAAFGENRTQGIHKFCLTKLSFSYTAERKGPMPLLFTCRPSCYWSQSCRP